MKTPSLKSITIAGAILACIAVSFGFTKGVAGPESDGFTLVADFKDVSPLIEGNDVRLNGVRVGEIERMEIVNGGARVHLDLEPTALPVYRNARLSSRPVSLLGERYLDLDPGTPQAGQLTDGGQLDQRQTGSATDLDEVLTMLDRPTSQSLAALITTLGIGLDGNGKNVGAAVRALAPAMRDTQALTRVLKEQNEVLGSLVESFEPVASGLGADNGRALDTLVASAHEMLGATARRETAFREMLRQLPGTLTSARTTLDQLAGTAAAAVPTLEALQPTTQDLARFSRELEKFAESADPALKAANPVLEEARRLIDEAAPVAEQLRLQARDMTTTARAVDPLTKKLASDFTAVMEFFKGWALATNGRDGLAHYFRAGFVATPYSATGLIPSLDSRRPPNPFDPTASEPHRRGSTSGSSLPSVDEVLPGSILPPQTSPDGGVTGLDAQQEQGVLNFLLGGL